MDNQDKKKVVVNIEKVFKSKNPKLAAILPKFIFNYIRRIIHEDFINEYLEKHGDKYGADFAEASIKEFKVTVETEGAENFSKSGRYIFASNHPLGGFDGVIMIHLLNQMGFKYKLLVNDILMNIKNLGVDFLPLNKHGALPREIANIMDETFASDQQIVTFPSGMVSRRKRGVIKDLTWQKSFIMKARKYQRDVIPVHFSGRNSSFFYNLHSIRSFLGIKANIEMFYLMDETYKHRNETIKVTFGKPISYKIFDSKYKPIEWANKIKNHVYEIAVDSETNFKF